MKWFRLLAVGIVVLTYAPELCAQLAQPTDFERRVTITPERKRSTRTGGGDWDDKTDRISFTIKFTNTDSKLSFNGCKVEFYVFGESTQDRRAFQLLGAHKAGLALEPLATQDITTDEVTSKFDTTGIKFGSKYEGWVLLVHDAAGKLLTKKASSAAWLPVAEKLPTLAVGKFYSRDLKPNTKVN